MAFCLPDNSWRPLLQLLGSVVLSEHWGCHGQIFCPQVFSVPWSASYGSLSWDCLGFIVVLLHVLPTDTPDLYGLWRGPVCCGLASRQLSLSSRYQETQCLSLFLPLATSIDLAAHLLPGLLLSAFKEFRDSQNSLVPVRCKSLVSQ